jgi:hypothetical protein
MLLLSLAHTRLLNLPVVITMSVGKGKIKYALPETSYDRVPVYSILSILCDDTEVQMSDSLII